MKKAVAMFMAVLMVLALSATAFAAGPLSLNQAKQAALDYAGVKVSEATFTKAHKDYDDGRQVYEIEFYANNTEYDMDVDVNTGRVTDFSTEYHGGYGQPGFGYGYHEYDYDRYDDDWDDLFDDDWFDWDD